MCTTAYPVQFLMGICIICVSLFVIQGYDEDLIEVREIMSLNAPARYYTPPSDTAYCVVAKRKIRPGQFIAIYCGVVDQDIQNPGLTLYLYYPHYIRCILCIGSRSMYANSSAY